MHTPHLSSGGRYPVLRSLGILYVIGAAVVILSGIVGAVWALIDFPGGVSDRLLVAAASLAGSLLLMIGLLAVAEGLKLIIDIERNTRMAVLNASRDTNATLPPVTAASPDGVIGGRMRMLEEETAEAALIRGH